MLTPIVLKEFRKRIYDESNGCDDGDPYETDIDNYAETSQKPHERNSKGDFGCIPIIGILLFFGLSCESTFFFLRSEQILVHEYRASAMPGKYAVYKAEYSQKGTYYSDNKFSHIPISFLLYHALHIEAFLLNGRESLSLL